MEDFRQTLSGVLSPGLRRALASLPDATQITEIRIRAEQQAQARRADGTRLPLSWTASADDVAAMARALLGHSRYAHAENLRSGYVTLAGGCRAGLCGHAALERGRILQVEDVGAIALRIAHALPGAADACMPYLFDGDRPVSALLFSVPGQGKTTLLRDAIRQASLRGLQIGVADERAELAACVRGIPQLDVGPCTDVLDNAPRAEGLRLLLRAFSPQVLATDELGRPEDVDAVLDAAGAGVAVWTTAHGDSLHNLRMRPAFRRIFAQQAFARYLLLAPTGTPGRLAGVWDAAGRAVPR